LKAEHFAWCKDKKFSDAMALAGFNEAGMTHLYDAMMNIPQFSPNPIDQVTMYNKAVCAFIKKSAPNGVADSLCSEYLQSLQTPTNGKCFKDYFTKIPAQPAPPTQPAPPPAQPAPPAPPPAQPAPPPTWWQW